MSYSEPQIRGMITARAKEIEEIMLRCAHQGLERTVGHLVAALQALIEAKAAVATEMANTPVQVDQDTHKEDPGPVASGRRPRAAESEGGRPLGG